MRRGGLCFATTHPSDRTQSAAQHLLAIAASSNTSFSFLQQAGPADIWHWTGRHREPNGFCPSAQLSGRSQLHESCILSQNLPKVIFFLLLNMHIHKDTQFSYLSSLPKCSHTLQKRNKLYHSTVNNQSSWKQLSDKWEKTSYKKKNFYNYKVYLFADYVSFIC